MLIGADVLGVVAGSIVLALIKVLGPPDTVSGLSPLAGAFAIGMVALFLSIPYMIVWITTALAASDWVSRRPFTCSLSMAAITIGSSLALSGFHRPFMLVAIYAGCASAAYYLLHRLTA